MNDKVKITVFLIFMSFPLFGLQPVDRLVAVVNNEPLSAQELNKKIQLMEKKLQAAQQPIPSQTVLKQAALEALITEHLELQRADEEGIQVDDISLDETLSRMAMSNQMSLAQFQEVVEHEGISFKEYREEIRKQMKISRFEQRLLATKIKLSDDAIKAALADLKKAEQNNKRYRVFHTVIDRGLPRAEKEAAELVKLIQQSDNLEKLTLSDGTSIEGLIFYETAENLPLVIATEVEKMQKGEVRGPLFTEGGVHVIKLLEKVNGIEKHEVQETEVRHILIKKEPLLSDEKIKAKLKALANEIRHGKSFATLAKVHSADLESAKQGGSLGWVKAGDLVPAFEKAMNDLNLNEVSEPVQSPYGWHLIQVQQRRVRDDTAAYLEQKAREQVYAAKFEEARTALLKRLRDEAFVEIL